MILNKNIENLQANLNPMSVDVNYSNANIKYKK